MNMFPCLPFQCMANRWARDAVTLGKPFVGRPTGAKADCFQHDILGELSVAMLASTRESFGVQASMVAVSTGCPAAFSHVPHVSVGVVGVEMVGPTAEPIVAAVANIRFVFGRVSVDKNVDQPVGSPPCPIERKNTVPVLAHTSSPRPASSAVGLLYSSKDKGNGRLRMHLDLQCRGAMPEAVSSSARALCTGILP